MNMMQAPQNGGKEIREKDSFGGAGIFIYTPFQKIPAAPPESVPLFLAGVVPPFHIKIIQETYYILWTFSSLLYAYVFMFQLMSLYFSLCLYTSKHPHKTLHNTTPSLPPPSKTLKFAQFITSKLPLQTQFRYSRSYCNLFPDEECTA